MKKIVSVFLAMLVMIMCSACASKDSNVDMQPQTSQMKSICEFATMKCYYHTVAKYFEEEADGVLLWKKDRKFWVEYSGVVTLGIDTSLLEMEINEEQVVITIPQAVVQGCKVDKDSLTEESFIVDKDSAEVLAEHQTAVYKEAQSKLAEAARNDVALLASAQDRAKDLIEQYVKSIGDLTGKNYSVTFVDANSNVQIQTQATEAQT